MEPRDETANVQLYMAGLRFCERASDGAPLAGCGVRVKESKPGKDVLQFCPKIHLTPPMLSAIHVKNYRGFKARANLEIRPLTILLGKNSSGKSSLTRLLPLIQQSIETPSSVPILWSAEQVDLGNITDVITHDSTGTLDIGFRIATDRLDEFISRRYLPPRRSTKHEVPTVIIDYTLHLSDNSGKTSFDGITVLVDDQKLSVRWDHAGSVKDISVDDERIALQDQEYTADTTSIFPHIGKRIDDEALPRYRRGGVFHYAIINALADVLHGRTSEDKVFDIAASLNYLPKNNAEALVRELPNVVKSKITKSRVKTLSNLSFVNNIPSIMEFLEFNISSIFQSLGYIRPVRASGKRFDRIQELAVNRIDASGENTAMYIYSLTDKERESFNALLKQACGYAVDVSNSGPGHVSVKVGSEEQGHFENIADVGFGLSQILPVVAQLHALIERGKVRSPYFFDQRMFAVEQPELHLHPALQANLADMFVGVFCRKDANSPPRSAVIETHSESMLSRFGQLVASGELQPSDIAIHFVEKDAEGFSSIRSVEFDHEGLISDWPIGFFSRA